MTILVDVNLSPLWVPYFKQHGIRAIYWADVGPMDAPDAELMRFAVYHGHVLMTHDWTSVP
jgi:predicted nuclease of predicted toxin-antitoxin system